jgi:hypothetical protein
MSVEAEGRLKVAGEGAKITVEKLSKTGRLEE